MLLAFTNKIMLFFLRQLGTALLSNTTLPPFYPGNEIKEQKKIYMQQQTCLILPLQQILPTCSPHGPNSPAYIQFGKRRERDRKKNTHPHRVSGETPLVFHIPSPFRRAHGLPRKLSKALHHSNPDKTHSASLSLLDAPLQNHSLHTTSPKPASPSNPPFSFHIPRLPPRPKPQNHGYVFSFLRIMFFLP